MKRSRRRTAESTAEPASSVPMMGRLACCCAFTQLPLLRLCKLPSPDTWHGSAHPVGCIHAALA